jgi:phosphonate transport system substrate-binding protein
MGTALILPVRRRLLIFLAGMGVVWPTLASATNEANLPERPTLHLGVVSERANQPDYVLTQYAPFLEYLRSELDLQGIALGELRIAGDLAQLAQLIRTRKVDFILESMMSNFRINADRALVEPSLAAWRKGRRETRTVFFVRQSSRIQHLRDLAGKTLALESPRSTTAYALPKIVLRQQGMDVQLMGNGKGGPKSVRYVLAVTESNQAYWVDRGQAEAGAFNTEDWEGLPTALRQELRIIHTTAPILRWLLSSRIGLPAAHNEAVQRVLLNMHDNPAGLQALQQAGRIRRFDPLSADDKTSIKDWRLAAARARFGE